MQIGRGFRRGLSQATPGTGGLEFTADIREAELSRRLGRNSRVEPVAEPEFTADIRETELSRVGPKFTAKHQGNAAVQELGRETELSRVGRNSRLTPGKRGYHGLGRGEGNRAVTVLPV